MEYHSKEESLKLHFFYIFSDYVMFLFINKRCYWSLVLLQLHLFISWDKISLTNMFVVSISKHSVTFISWKSSEKELEQNIGRDIGREETLTFQTLEMLLRLHLKFFLCSKIHISVFTCSYNMVPPQIFSATFLRFDQIGNKMQQPFRNQRQSLYGTQNVNITSNDFEHVLTISCNLKRTKSKLKKMFWQQLRTQTLDSQFSLRMW